MCKRFYYLCTAAVLFFAGCRNTKSDPLTAVITKEELQKDFQVFKNIVKSSHAGVYLYNSPQQFNFIFDSIYNTIDAPLTLREFYNRVDYAANRLCCIHTNTYLPDDYYDTISNRTVFFPVPVIVVNERLYINSDAYTMPLGSEIVAIAENNARSIIKKISSYLHTDGFSDGIKGETMGSDFAYYYFLAYGSSELFELRYVDKTTGRIEVSTLKAEKLKTIYKNQYTDSWYYFPADPLYDFEMLDDRHAAIITIRSFNYRSNATKTAFAHFLDNSFRLVRQNNIKSLIIDVRNNGGGQYSNAYSLLSYLVNEPLKEYDSSIRYFERLPYSEFLTTEDSSMLENEDSVRRQFSQIRKNVYVEHDTLIDIWQPASFVFGGNIFVITNSNIASAGSNFVAILKEKTKAVIVGDETGGNNAVHNAYVYTYRLPNSQLTVDIPTRRFYQPVEPKADGRGVLPHKFIPTTLTDVVENNDSPLNYILDTLLQKK